MLPQRALEAEGPKVSLRRGRGGGRDSTRKPLLITTPSSVLLPSSCPAQAHLPAPHGPCVGRAYEVDYLEGQPRGRGVGPGTKPAPSSHSRSHSFSINDDRCSVLEAVLSPCVSHSFSSSDKPMRGGCTLLQITSSDRGHHLPKATC